LFHNIFRSILAFRWNRRISPDVKILGLEWWSKGAQSTPAPSAASKFTPNLSKTTLATSVSVAQFILNHWKDHFWGWTIFKKF